MPQPAQNTRVCRDCDGFATVAITTGTRHDDDSRVTLRITCTGCNGTGHTVPAALARTGR